MHSAATGQVIGFDGRLLQVRRWLALVEVPSMYPWGEMSLERILRIISPI